MISSSSRLPTSSPRRRQRALALVFPARIGQMKVATIDHGHEQVVASSVLWSDVVARGCRFNKADGHVFSAQWPSLSPAIRLLTSSGRSCQHPNPSDYICIDSSPSRQPSQRSGAARCLVHVVTTATVGWRWWPVGSGPPPWRTAQFPM